MGIVANCDCGWSAVVADRFEGKRVKCPECRKAVAIDGGEHTEPAIEPHTGHRRLVFRSIAIVVGLAVIGFGTAEGLALAFGRPGPTESLLAVRRAVKADEPTEPADIATGITPSLTYDPAQDICVLRLDLGSPLTTTDLVVHRAEQMKFSLVAIGEGADPEQLQPWAYLILDSEGDCVSP
jgi:hypothetical protein